MKTKKYIEIEKGKNGRKYINRFMHLLNLLSPDKYELDTLNLMAGIENNETNLTAVLFSENPFR